MPKKHFNGYLTDYAWSIIYTIVCSVLILLGIAFIDSICITPYIEAVKAYKQRMEVSNEP